MTRPSEVKNLLKDLPSSLNVEHVETLLESGSVRVERIISTGHASPSDYWYDQNEDEWVFVVKGRAQLSFETPARSVELKEGDSLIIPAHHRHRVDWTDPDGPTVWLAVFYPS